MQNFLLLYVVVLGPSKANSPVDVIVNFASRSGERGVVLGMFYLSAWMK